MYEDTLPQPYDYFSQTVTDISTGLIKSRYLGGGSESQVYEAVLDDRKYAVKFAKRFTRLDRPRNTAKATQRKIDAGIRGLGIVGLEQIQAASPVDGVAIYDLVEGITVNRMDDGIMQKVTEIQLKSFYDSIDQAVEVGIEFDPWNQDGSNVLYNPSDGFTLIDYFVDYANTTPEESRLNGRKALGSKAIKLAKIFGECS